MNFRQNCRVFLFLVNNAVNPETSVHFSGKQKTHTICAGKKEGERKKKINSKQVAMSTRQCTVTTTYFNKT